MPPYKSAPIDCTTSFDAGPIKGRTVIITGGAKGIGEGYVRALADAGAHIVIGDLDEDAGKVLATEHPDTVRCFKCDVTKWSDQLSLFKEAIAFSPSGRVDVVVVNAGIGAGDSIGDTNISLPDDPTEPLLKTLSVNLIGAVYTVKLALHYFRKQYAENNDVDQVLILGGSLAGYIDTTGALEYGISKHGLRSLMTSLRRSEWQHNIRVAFIGPWFVKTNILPEQIIAYLESRKAQFASVEHCAEAVKRIIADKNITGRAFAILPTTMAPAGYMDVNCDDFPEGHILNTFQTEYDRSLTG